MENLYSEQNSKVIRKRGHVIVREQESGGGVGERGEEKEIVKGSETNHFRPALEHGWLHQRFLMHGRVCARACV